MNKLSSAVPEQTIKRALISVSDKRGASKLAAALTSMGVKILSTGGTAKALSADNIPITEVSDYTGFPEMLDGRLKTLHPKIHGGLLARRDLPAHMDAIQKAGIETIDLVAVNLYPFSSVIASPGCTLDEAMENIDIGGPTMLRSAAKNWRSVTVLVNPEDYDGVIELIRAKGSVPPSIRYELACKVFQHTANYDSVINEWLQSNGLLQVTKLFDID